MIEVAGSIRRALVTGGGGFLGGEIVRALRAQGVEVRSLSRGRYPDLEALGVEHTAASITDTAALKIAARGCDVVFHCSGKADAWGRREDFYAVNVDGTRAVIAACHAQNVPRLVFTSSPMAVFSGRHQAGIDETIPYPKRFPSLYSETKAIAEQEVMAANSGRLATVSLRPRLCWGPRDNGLIPRLLDKAKKGQLAVIGKEPRLIDSTVVENAVDAHLLAALHAQPGDPAAGNTYFISNGEPLPMEALINKIVGAYGFPPVKRRVPRTLAMAVAVACETVWSLLGKRSEPPMSRFVVQNMSTTNWFDISAARRDLGYVPAISIDEGIARLRTAAGVHTPE